MILPLIEYGNCLLSCTNVEKTKIQGVRNKGIKLVFNKNRIFSTKLLPKGVVVGSRALAGPWRLMFKYKYTKKVYKQADLAHDSRAGQFFVLIGITAKTLIYIPSFQNRVE